MLLLDDAIVEQGLWRVMTRIGCSDTWTSAGAGELGLTNNGQCPFNVDHLSSACPGRLKPIT